MEKMTSMSVNSAKSTPYDESVAENIHDSIKKPLSVSNAGHYTIYCYTNDQSLSQTEWAFVIAVFDTHLSVGADFFAFDSKNHLIYR